jgi:hypothetical protein
MSTKNYELEQPPERETQAIQPAKHQPEPVIEPAPEISDELKRLSSQSDEPENEEENEPVKPKKSEVESCKSSAMGTLMVISSIADLFKIELGIDENAAAEWSEGVAPVMVKYDLIPSVNGSKWSAEIEALKATIALGFGMYMAYRASKEKQINEPPKKEKAKAEVVTDGD